MVPVKNLGELRWYGGCHYTRGRCKAESPTYESCVLLLYSRCTASLSIHICDDAISKLISSQGGHGNMLPNRSDQHINRVDRASKFAESLKRKTSPNGNVQFNVKANPKYTFSLYMGPDARSLRDRSAQISPRNLILRRWSPSRPYGAIKVTRSTKYQLWSQMVGSFLCFEKLLPGFTRRLKRTFHHFPQRNRDEQPH